jgi:hypothetical protein
MEQLLLGATAAEADLHVQTGVALGASLATYPPVIHLHSPVLRLNEVKSDLLTGSRLLLSKESAMELFKYFPLPPSLLPSR